MWTTGRAVSDMTETNGQPLLFFADDTSHDAGCAYARRPEISLPGIVVGQSEEESEHDQSTRKPPTHKAPPTFPSTALESPPAAPPPLRVRHTPALQLQQARQALVVEFGVTIVHALGEDELQKGPLGGGGGALSLDRTGRWI